MDKQAEKQNAWQQKLEAYEDDVTHLKAKQEEAKVQRAGLDDELEAVEIVHDKKNSLGWFEEATRRFSGDRLTELQDKKKGLLRMRGGICFAPSFKWPKMPCSRNNKSSRTI